MQHACTLQNLSIINFWCNRYYLHQLWCVWTPCTNLTTSIPSDSEHIPNIIFILKLLNFKLNNRVRFYTNNAFIHIQFFRHWNAHFILMSARSHQYVLGNIVHCCCFWTHPSSHSPLPSTRHHEEQHSQPHAETKHLWGGRASKIPVLDGN